MFIRTMRHRCVLAGVFAVALVSHSLAQTAKRPLTHQDYDAWRAIANQSLSRDGKFLAYALFPQEGDGELVVRNLTSGQEFRQPVGARPPAPRPDFSGTSEEPPVPPGLRLTFTADSRWLVSTTFPPKADMDAARRARKTGDAAPKGDLLLLDLATGAATRVPRVKSFQVPDKANGFVAYLKEPEPPAGATPPAESRTTEPRANDDDQARPGAGRPGGAGDRPQYGSDLVLRSLADQGERTFADVTEYTLAKDARTLAYAVSSKKPESNGVFAVAPASPDSPAPLLAGKGKYTRLTWDENQTQLAFLSDRDDAAAKKPLPKIYRWDRKGAAAPELVASAAAGLQPGYVVSDRGALSFSRDGKRLFFGVAPAPSPEPEKKADALPDEKPIFDLWHFKDDHVQPMQRIRATQERNRTYRAVCHLDNRRVLQLGDAALTDVTPNESGTYALGSDDRAYRPMREYDQTYADTYLVNTATGKRVLLAKQHPGRLSWSPDGNHAIFFDGKHWLSHALPEGTRTNLTATINVPFWNEETDTPSTPGPYGFAGWTKDGKHILLYDRYDIWEVAADGSGAKNLTDGWGRQRQVRLRAVKLNAEERAIDPAQPLLLRGENTQTWGTGFYEDRIHGTQPPVTLLEQPRNLSVPVRAKEADVLLLTGQTFAEFPDLAVTDRRFRDLRTVSRANPQAEQLSWGTAELVKFVNADGVPLQATLYKPANFDPARQYPLIVYIYERLSQNVNSFVVPRPSNGLNAAYYASNGYLVLMPDIVYTTGFPGQSAVKCVLPAVQAVVDKGFVNEAAIGIQGHSWGGYQIAYMVTQTNRFKAAAPGAPVANMVSAYNGIRWGPGLPRQFQYERTQSRIGGTLWQYPTRYLENSPIFMADRIRTPLLMMHNDADDAVPWYQGIEMFLALRRLGKEAYLFNYNGEPHNLRGRANQKDYTLRMQEFFDHYLKGAPKPAWMEKGIPYLEKEQPAAVATDAR